VRSQSRKPPEKFSNFSGFQIKWMAVEGNLVHRIHPLKTRNDHEMPFGCDPIVESLVDVIESLYGDQIAPTLPDILRRYVERNPNAAMISERHIIAIAEFSDKLIVSPFLPVTVYTAFSSPLVRFTGWVDPYDTQYQYPTSIWTGMQHFITCAMVQAVAVDAPHTTGGRYCAAKFIQDYTRKPITSCVYCAEFCHDVSHLSLGRLCQLVQCAITRGLLRYEQNVLQPTLSCHGLSHVLLSKLSHIDTNRDEIQSIEELETYLRAILLSTTNHQLDLSQLKKSFFRETGKFLNPRKLGFIKLSDIFTCSRMFRLETINNTVTIIKFSAE
jgi:hypothetical protein